MNALLKKHFKNYGFDDIFFRSYEQDAKDELQNIRTLCEKLYQIRLKKRKIVIFTDFDVDGIMSSIVAYVGLKELGFNVVLFAPTPSRGYGFGVVDVIEIYDIHPDAAVILTGDVGIGSIDAIEEAHNRGLSVFVTDHHCGAALNADVAVNPKQLGETYSQPGICGSYVLYKVIEKFANTYENESMCESIRYLRIFAGIATVSDSMPLLYENRQLVRDSVSLTQKLFCDEVCAVLPATPHTAEYIRAFIGIKLLLEYFIEKRKIRSVSDINEQFYGFYLVPFLNSCKRMDGDMGRIYDIFFNEYVAPLDGFSNMFCAKNGIKYVERLSDERRRLTALYYENICRERETGVTDNSYYMRYGVYITDARQGLLGLLGGKLMSLTGVPTLVVNMNADGSYSGSGRCPDWFDFIGRLYSFCPEIICKGHAEAFGIYIPNKNALDKYVEFFKDVFQVALSLCKIDSVSYNVRLEHNADYESEKLLIKDFLHEMEHYRPYGRSFPEPVFEFCVDMNDVLNNIYTFGSESQHTKIKTKYGIDVLMFNQTFDWQKIRQSSAGKTGNLVCMGSFHFDSYSKSESDAVVFFANEILTEFE